MDNSNDDVIVVKIVRKTDTKREMMDKSTQTEILGKESKLHVPSTVDQIPIVQNQECLICEEEPNANANVAKTPKANIESNYIKLNEYDKQATSDKHKLVPKRILKRTKTDSFEEKSEAEDLLNAKHPENEPYSKECNPSQKDSKIVHGYDALKSMRIVSPKSINCLHVPGLSSDPGFKDKNCHLDVKRPTTANFEENSGSKDSSNAKDPENGTSFEECSPSKKDLYIVHESEALKRTRTVSPRSNNSLNLLCLTSDPGFTDAHRHLELKRTETDPSEEKSESKDLSNAEQPENEPSSNECSPSRKYSKIVLGSDLLKRMRTVLPRSSNSLVLPCLTSDPGFTDALCHLELKRTETDPSEEKSESKDLSNAEQPENEPSSNECSPSRKYSKIVRGSDLLKRVRTVSPRSNNGLDPPSLILGAGFIDTHCHLDFLFERQNYRGTHAGYMQLHKDTYPANYEGCVTVFCDPFSFQQEEIWQTYLEEEGIWAAFGCHPKHAKYYDDHIESALCSALFHSKVRALGEIGLDYSERNTSPKNTQHQVLKRQLRIALALNLPLVIHCRDATDDCMTIMKEAVPRDHHIHLHCFNEGWNIAHEWLRAFPNLFIGLTNLVTYPNARPVHEVAKHISLKRLLLETDAPYFLPKKGPRGSRFSHPGMAIHVATQIAALREMSVEEVLYWTRQNTRKMYGI